MNQQIIGISHFNDLSVFAQFSQPKKDVFVKWGYHIFYFTILL